MEEATFPKSQRSGRPAVPAIPTSNFRLTEILVDYVFTFWNAWVEHKDTMRGANEQASLKSTVC